MFKVAGAIIGRLLQTEGADYIHSGYLGFNVPSRELHKKLGFVPLAAEFIELDGEQAESIEVILWKS